MFVVYTAILTPLILHQAAAAEEPFSCNGRPTGYYADVASDCQQYHVCNGGKRQYTYSCPNTTRFQQRMMICDHWYLVDCSRSEKDFGFNLLIGQKGVPFVRAEELLSKKSSKNQLPISTVPQTIPSKYYNKTTLATTTNRPLQKLTALTHQPAEEISVNSVFKLSNLPRPFSVITPKPNANFVISGNRRTFETVSAIASASKSIPKTTAPNYSLNSHTSSPTQSLKTTFTPFTLASGKPFSKKNDPIFVTSKTTTSPLLTLSSSSSKIIPKSFFPSTTTSSFLHELVATRTPPNDTPGRPRFVDENSIEARSLRHPEAVKLEWTLPDTRAMLFIPDNPEEAVVPNIKKFSVTIPQPRMNFREPEVKNSVGPCPGNCHLAFIEPGTCLPCVSIKK